MAERAPEPEAEASAGREAAAEAAEEGAAGRKARGRPRLTESDRARRRLESRKKYDVRRVYLGEAHGPWVDLRRRSGWSDAKLAAYLISLERGQRSGRHGKPWEQVPKKPKRKKRRRRNVNCLKNVVIWYEDHKHRCPYEPHLAELDPTFGLYTTAVWQCEAGHRYFQDLHSPLKPLSDSEPESDKGVCTGQGTRDSRHGGRGGLYIPHSWSPEPELVKLPFDPSDPEGPQNHVNLVHRKGKTKVCPHPGCGKKFYLSNHLRRHMIIHSGVREFTCETCGKSFKRKNHLEVHRRTHTGETPLQCEICGYQCRQRASLNWHMKKHTAEVQYNFTCERCGKRFEKLDSVKFHTLKSHPDHKPT
ncbi:zinc finger protein 653 [Nannospalax galili]|uniref:zinc finger protein 653 n=1 Tax=Nannospalax galili TaxID=1026970 RepID=UPI0004ED6654|nr:zinc finger protein 653 [Nannospalax galili]